MPFILQNDKGEYFAGWTRQVTPSEPSFITPTVHRSSRSIVRVMLLSEEATMDTIERLTQRGHPVHKVQVGGDVDALREQVAVLEALRPHWAQGHTSDGVAAQSATAALAQLWEMLGASNQTEAVQKLQALTQPIGYVETGHLPMLAEVRTEGLYVRMYAEPFRESLGRPTVPVYGGDRVALPKDAS